MIILSILLFAITILDFLNKIYGENKIDTFNILLIIYFILYWITI